MLATLGFLLLAQRGELQDPRRSYAAGDKDAILMFPPVTVCDGDVQEMEWTADGSALVVRRMVSSFTPADMTAMVSGKAVDPARLASRVELLVWSAKSHKSRVAVSGDAASLTIDGFYPMAGSDRVVFGSDERIAQPDGTTRTVSAWSVLATGSGTITRLGGFDANQTYVGVSLSPTRPLGYVSAIDATTKARSARFFGSDGRLGNAIPLPSKSHLVFNEAGLPMLTLGYDKVGKKVTFHFQKVDSASGTLGERYDGMIDDEYDPSAHENPIKAAPVRGTADGTVAPSILLRIQGGKPAEAGVVTTDGERGLVSPKGDAVAYVGQGSAIVRPLAKVSRKEYDSAVLAAQKAIAMSKAKQVALGLIMFSADMDDEFPKPGDYRKVDPYLLNTSMMDSFTYTFGGGKQADIEKPAETELGYVSGPGGRAVAYADGHVKWVPNTP